MLNINVTIPPAPPANSSSNTISLWSTALTAQEAYNTAAIAFQNGVIADEIANGTTSNPSA